MVAMTTHVTISILPVPVSSYYRYFLKEKIDMTRDPVSVETPARAPQALAVSLHN